MVLSKNTVDEAFDTFSNIFTDIYKITFPLDHYKFKKYSQTKQIHDKWPSKDKVQ
jgi:hypothetical protein